ncbi:MAG TPA: TetR/AcrR family transcriptional regulator [Candidatus Dormibacteraeota bacterium]|jgi:AcrR family transcriptional regulator|nr:TetR/AcrR family transcriptional regulator [Candidatus Dormibacteraeota bacterium]
MSDGVGLRERKKRETRQHISDVATGMFLARGFDEVSVAEVAEAAGVSKMTVFNYFSRKEDLFFDRGEETVDLLSAAVAAVGPDEPPLAGLRRLVLDLIDRRHALSGMGDGFGQFWRVVIGSPTLQASARERIEGAEALLAGLLANRLGEEGRSERPRLMAALFVAAYRTEFLATVARQLAGERTADIIEDHVARINRALDAVDRAVDGL